MDLQPIFDIAEICYQHGLTQVVLSPGSRCAPLTLAFSRHPQINVRTVSDERAAAFIGLGIAQVSKNPTILVCTSGTAAYNYAPAVAEAFYQQVPLLVITADRPPEWIDQLDGQTIRQENIYNRHIKRSFNYPADVSHPDSRWYAERIFSEAINEARAFPPGPVHINIPLREPFYPEVGATLNIQQPVKIIKEDAPAYMLSPDTLKQLQEELSGFKRILIVAGQGSYQPELQLALTSFLNQTGAVLVADIISNLHLLPASVRAHDVFLNGKQTLYGNDLRPDLVITFGLSNISKNLKMYLRAFGPQAHWHLQPAGPVADPFQSLTRIIRIKPQHFFTALSETSKESDIDYAKIWQQKEAQATMYLHSSLAVDNYNEFVVFKKVLDELPENSLLHLANSMAVRYANIIGLNPAQQVEVFANRGTSGIDGCTSTTVGAALSTDKLTTLITGDLAFFYDRNGLWHNYLPPKLRLVLLNNHAGGIFRIIDGPKQQPELEEFFETRQLLNAENTARDFAMHYYPCHSLTDLEKALPSFWQNGAGILEVFTQSPANAAFFDRFKKDSPFKKS